MFVNKIIIVTVHLVGLMSPQNGLQRYEKKINSQSFPQPGLLEPLVMPGLSPSCPAPTGHLFPRRNTLQGDSTTLRSVPAPPLLILSLILLIPGMTRDLLLVMPGLSPSCPAPTGHLLARRSTPWTFRREITPVKAQFLRPEPPLMPPPVL